MDHRHQHDVMATHKTISFIHHAQSESGFSHFACKLKVKLCKYKPAGCEIVFTTPRLSKNKRL